MRILIVSSALFAISWAWCAQARADKQKQLLQKVQSESTLLAFMADMGKQNLLDSLNRYVNTFELETTEAVQLLRKQVKQGWEPAKVDSLSKKLAKGVSNQRWNRYRLRMLQRCLDKTCEYNGVDASLQAMQALSRHADLDPRQVGRELGRMLRHYNRQLRDLDEGRAKQAKARIHSKTKPNKQQAAKRALAQKSEKLIDHQQERMRDRMLKRFKHRLQRDLLQRKRPVFGYGQKNAARYNRKINSEKSKGGQYGGNESNGVGWGLDKPPADNRAPPAIENSSSNPSQRPN